MHSKIKIKDAQFIKMSMSDDPSNSEFLKLFKEYHNDQVGTDPKEFKFNCEEIAFESYQRHCTFLRNMLLDADALIDDRSLSVTELEEGHTEVLKNLNKLNDIINKAYDPLPDMAAFVSELRLDLTDGSSLEINNGMNEKIANTYKSRGESLKEKAAIIEKRIQYQLSRQQESGDDESIGRLGTIPATLLYLNELGILDALRAATNNQSLQARIIARITGIGSERSIRPILSILQTLINRVSKKSLSEKSLIEAIKHRNSENKEISKNFSLDTFDDTIAILNQDRLTPSPFITHFRDEMEKLKNDSKR